MNAPDYITVSGRRYARTVSLLTETLFEHGGTACGLFKARSNGVLLANPAGVPLAFICSNGRPFIVTACRDEESGLTRYMYGLAEHTREVLALPESYAAECAIAADVIRQVTP